MRAVTLERAPAPRPARARRVLAVIPARNEATAITATLRSLAAQTRLPDRVIVVANNCTDDTADRARRAGAEVVELPSNPELKAGALNAALEDALAGYAGDDAVLVMDADTVLSPRLVEECVGVLAEDRLVGGVGSVFTGPHGAGGLGYLQVMEFQRYRRQLHRNGRRAFVLSGTASVFRVSALREIRAARRDGRLPHGGGSYYSTTGRTEDNEITLALRALDFDCPVVQATSVTDVMATPAKLYRQRERWYHGALVNLRCYGWSLPGHLKWIYWKQQLGLLFSAAGLVGYLFVLAVGLNYHQVRVSALWLLPFAVLVIERVATVWPLGWKARTVAALIVPEMVYSAFLTATFAAALGNYLRGRSGRWHHT